MNSFVPTPDFLNSRSLLAPQDRQYMAQSLSPIVDLLRGKIVLLTGGTGFFGKWLLESYIAVQDQFAFEGELVVLSRSPERFLLANPFFREFPYLTFVQGDVRDAFIPYPHFDYIIHAATEASATLERDNPDEMYSVVVDGTRQMLDLANRTGAARFLLTSSGAVYGPQPPNLPGIPESYRGVPTTAYGKGKLAAEQLVLETARQSRLVAKIARCFAFVGPYLNLDIHFAVGNFIRNGLIGEPIIIRGDGTPFRSYLYAAELAVWLWKILLIETDEPIFNVGSPVAVSIRELAERVSQTFQREDDRPHPLEVRVMQTPTPGVLPARYAPDVSLIDQKLGLRAQISLEDGILRTLRFHRRSVEGLKRD